MENQQLSSEFLVWIKDLKSKIRRSQNQLAFSINKQLLELYWEIGKELSKMSLEKSWGTRYIEATAMELKHEFPNVKGLSRRNLYAMKQWFEFFSDKNQIVPQAVAQIPWGHNRLIISKIKDIDQANFYISETIKNGWSRDTLEVQIKNNLFERSGKSLNNFETSLPENQSKLAKRVLKDPYYFDFLGLESDALELAVEDELVRNITKFLLELGKGFAFIGRQYKIEISETDYFLDMLFYHVELKSYVVIELKSGKFKPEFAGKLNFYLSAVDSQIKGQSDNPTIGILLCKTRDKIEVEYALRDINKPMGISEYKLSESLPSNFRSQLPTIEELENKLANSKNSTDENKA